MSSQSILKSALKLSPDDRCRLADRLYESATSDGELTEAFKAELDSLVRDDDENPEEGVSWENLKNSLTPKPQKRSTL